MKAASLLVLGGARSGKSGYAQRRAEACGGSLVFIATAQALDDEMAERIARHRADRDRGWTTIEAPLDVAEAVRAHAGPGATVLVDCLTLWASNLMFAERDVAHESAKLAVAIAVAAGPVILVTNEVGLGIVPDNALARRFRDLAGTINQSVATVADEVVMMVAGLPMTVKAPRASGA